MKTNEHMQRCFVNISHGVTRMAISIVVMTTALSAVAVNINYEQAAAVARQYVDVEVPSKTRAFGAENVTAERPYFIFNDKKRGNGFVIVGGNETTASVIGYSDKGYVDTENLPEGLRALLSAFDSGELSVAANAAAPASPVVEPLVKSKWYQLAPYNYNLPSRNYLTGCVATAMAQIIRFHQWPEGGHGSGSYISFYEKAPHTHVGEGLIEYDLNGSVYDYANMRDIYLDDNWNEKEADAVASLIRDCGFATHMQYTTTTSSSFDQDCATALTENFGYDVECFEHFGDYRNTDKWLARMKSEFDAGFPVIMNGQGGAFGGGGHCFIGDGYDSNGFIHINWGWNGDADGYYDISALQPLHHGSLHNYSFFQNFLSVHPRRPYSDARYNPTVWMLWDSSHTDLDHSGLTVENADEPLTESSPARIRLDGLFCNSLREYDGELRLVLIDGDGNELRTVATSALSRGECVSEEQGQAIDLKYILIEAKAFYGIPDGDYTIVPISVFEYMAPKRVPVYGYKDHINVKVENGTFTLSSVATPETCLKFVKTIAVPDQINLFSTINTEVVLANDSEVFDGGTLSLYIATEDESVEIKVKSIQVAVYEHSQTHVPISLDIVPKYPDSEIFVIQPGKKYKLRMEFVNFKHEKTELEGTSGPIDFTVTLDESLIPHLEITSVKVTDGDGKELPLDDLRIDTQKDYYVTYDYQSVGKGTNPEKIDEIDFQFGEITMHRVEKNESNDTCYFEILSYYFHPEPGESRFILKYTDFLTGEMRMASPENLAIIPVTVYDSSSGVSDIQTEVMKTEVARYNALGVKIAATTAGLNIIIYNDGSVEKVIR